MTQGSVWKSIVMFTLPMLIGNIAQQFYSTVDTIVVGRFAQNGDNAIAAVNAAPMTSSGSKIFRGAMRSQSQPMATPEKNPPTDEAELTMPVQYAAFLKPLTLATSSAIYG